jgi:heme A synthase
MAAPLHSQINPDVTISYNLMRKLIGIIGVTLPFILVIGSLAVQRCASLQVSISHYYYSIMHIAFVATLCMLGLFLIAYRSEMKLERWVSNIAGAAAFGVAAFPTNFKDFQNDSSCQYLAVTIKPFSFINSLHYGFAAILFTCFAIFCFKIFQHSDKPTPDSKKGRRNMTYKICGIIITVSVAAIALFSFVLPAELFPYATIVFETTALLAFGFSWLLKGSGDLKDTHNKIIKPLVKFYR